MKAKEFLERNLRLKAIIDTNVQELKETQSLIECISSIDFSKEVRNPNTNTDAIFVYKISEIDELKNIIEEDIKKLINARKDIRNVISCVKDEKNRIVLMKRYLLALTWKEICNELDVSKRTIDRRHSEGLAEVEKILYKQ